jgi:uncharacterized protein (DUF488 family)
MRSPAIGPPDATDATDARGAGNSDGAGNPPPPLFTVGHSTRAGEELLALLAEHRVQLLVDVRRFPASRRHPQFAQGALAASLAAAGIAYRHEPDLGGRRAPVAGSPHTAWRVAAFRAYADHMESAPFQAALDRLLASSARQRTVVLCAEAVPWRCHRRLIADAATARGVAVLHILAPGRADPHQLDANARVTGSLPHPRLIYDGGAGTAPLLPFGDRRDDRHGGEGGSDGD